MAAKSGRRNLTLDDIMKWAFKTVKSKGKEEKPNLELMLDATGRKGTGILPLMKKIEKDLGGKLNRAERVQLREILRETENRNVIIHSRKILQYMWDLYMHNSKIPPPWMC